MRDEYRWLPPHVVKGWLVDFRIVKRHHDHRGATIWVPFSESPNWHNASTEEEAVTFARSRLRSIAEEPTNTGSRHPPIGYVKVESVTLVELKAEAKAA